LGPAWIGAFPQNIVFIFSAAFLSYRLIEKPFLSLKDRLGSDQPRQQEGLARVHVGSYNPLKETPS
jgi:hypothetical protein